MFKAILFDFDGTLVDFVDSDIQSLKWLHSYTGSLANFDDFLQTSVAEIMKFHHLVAERQINPLLMHEFRLKNSFTRHAIEWKDNYVNLYQKQLIETCRPLDGIEKLLVGLKPKGKIGLITNAYDAKEQRERIKNSGLEAYFDVIVIAGEIGIYKPEPSIFLYALNSIGVEPDQALYIGDSVTYDMVGAKSAGMKTVLFNKDSNRQASAADYTIDGVAELQVLLDRIVT
jgi:HAD superfamily hydrolase (TIGR01549 family)